MEINKYFCSFVQTILRIFIKTTIKELASIQTGVFAKADRQGDAVYLQVKYFDDFGYLNLRVQPDLFIDKRISKHLLIDGDILFAAKGSKNIAAVYSAEIGPAVASSSFFVIRIDSKSKGLVLPEYLAWLINHPHNQKILKSQAKGSSLPSISIGVIGGLTVGIPEIIKQHAILHIHKLRNKEKELTTVIEGLKDTLLQEKLIRGHF